jgi:methyl-accepting chemotaxis protein
MSFGILVVILAGMSFYAIKRIHGIEESIKLIVDDRMQKTEIANNIIDLVNMNARAVRNMMLTNDAQEKASQANRIAENNAKVKEYYDSLEATITSNEGKQNLSTALNARRDYLATSDQLMKLITAGEKEASVAYLFNDQRIAQQKYFDGINELVSFQTELAKNDGKAAEETALALINLLQRLAIVAIAFSVLMAWYIARSITHPISQCVEVANKVASGDLNFSVELDKNDEVGMLQKALAKMAERIRALTTDAHMLSQAAVEGKLDIRADATKHQGDFRKIVQGVNDTLDSVIGPLNVAAEYVDRISKGDVPAKITDKYNGDFNEIKNNLNQCIDAVNGLVADANLLSKAAVEGKLDIRADATKHQGDFRKIVDGVNHTLDAVIGPLNVAAEYIDRVAKGDIPEKIRDNYNGDFNEIKNNLNQLIDAIKTLIGEMGHMSKEHDAGDIDVIIDPSKFQGAYQAMASGVNNMVNGHIAVKKKAMACIAEFGRGNFEANLEKFPGKKVFINETIEQVRKNLKALIVDANGLVEAAVAGQLDKRADASKHEGDFRKIVDGVNRTLDAVIGPLNVAAEYIDRIAKGEIPEKIRDNYNGDFNEVKNNLNMLIDSMNEVTRVAREISEGNLKLSVKQRSEGDELMRYIGIMLQNLIQFAVNVQNGAAEVSSGSRQSSITAEQISNGANEQSASVEEVSASMEEMNSMVNQNADNAQQTTAIAKKAAKDAIEGGKAVRETVASMKSITERIGIIEEIARRTNMLALNAAIEAARAGQHGKGFAVVAAEVRKLAERSQDAAKEIIGVSSSSVSVAENAGRLLDEIVPGIQKTAELVEEISASSMEQRNGITQVTSAIQQLEKVIQNNAAATEELASMSDELLAQGDNLMEAAGFFDIGNAGGYQSGSKTKAKSSNALSGGRSVKALAAPEKRMATAGRGVKLHLNEDDSSLES